MCKLLQLHWVCKSRPPLKMSTFVLWRGQYRGGRYFLVQSQICVFPEGFRFIKTVISAVLDELHLLIRYMPLLLHQLEVLRVKHAWHIISSLDKRKVKQSTTWPALHNVLYMYLTSWWAFLSGVCFWIYQAKSFHCGDIEFLMQPKLDKAPQMSARSSFRLRGSAPENCGLANDFKETCEGKYGLSTSCHCRLLLPSAACVYVSLQFHNFIEDWSLSLMVWQNT